MTSQESIGHYRITGKLGEGGMGAVYRATDTRLNRQVALKVLPPAFAEDAARMQRFDREAQVLASLNHPNIAAIYGVEQGAIVMELVEGSDLAGPLPAATVLDYARQMAAGLEAAHEKGIVHRDLKPANIKVTADGVVKLLDFGLAKAREEQSSSSAAASPTMPPTLSLAMTQAGMILGTAAYMSPEQARGKAVDRRSDIWAYGVILYELLTGRHPYGVGDTVTDTLAAIVLKEVDLSALPQETPPRLRRLIERCLRKDQKMRLRDIGDARLLLDEPEAEIAPAAAPVSFGRRWLPWAVAGLAVAMAAVTAGMAWKRLSAADPGPGTIRFSIPLPPDTTWPNAASTTQWVPSPDGRSVAMVVTAGGRNALWVRPLGASAAHRLDKTEGANYPFWSPDSQSIGFFTEGMLRRISVSGSGAGKICDLTSAGNANPGDGGTWNKDGMIVFAEAGKPLMRVSAQGGIPVPVTTLAKGETGHGWPEFLSDGRHVLYQTRGGAEAGIYVQELGSTKRVQVMKSSMRAIWAPPGFLLFTREGNLFAQRMNPGTFQLEGEPVSVAEDVQANESNGRSTFAVSQNGVLVYRFGSAAGERQISWRDREGKVLKEIGKAARVSTVSLAPDEKSVTVLVGESGGLDAWVMDLASGVLTPMTRDGNVAPTAAVWSPDSKLLAVSLRGGGVEEITVASGKITPLTKEAVSADDWSPDGGALLCREPGATRISLLSLSEGFPLKTVGTTPYRQTQFRFSPDGKYVAYTSTEAGTSEVWVAVFPTFAVKRRVSTGGGNNPQWAKGGTALYYLGRGATVMEAAIRTGADIEVGGQKELFRGMGRFGVTADGQRFLVGEGALKNTPAAAELSLVIDWPAEIKQ